ncbi:hypothetical protein [Solidesulfovibrio carbinoliphilus]|uniref:hypothetical protein n=1 Tax=Solidesulfovibrio carbinoliphilus TaxID=345370 RepID=UPI0012F4D3CF|nr:hypothetical protein [Solidesulfovibrio carbinoliphilus]
MTRKWICVVAMFVLLGLFANAWSGDGLEAITGNSLDEDSTGIALWARAVCPFGNETGFGLMFCFIDGNTSLFPQETSFSAPSAR